MKLASSCAALLGFWLVACAADPLEPMPPTPVPVIADWMVFFPANGVALSAQAEKTIAQFVAATKRIDGDVTINTRANGMGNAAANMELSRRRGEVIKARLIELGIPVDHIAINAEGNRLAQGKLNAEDDFHRVAPLYLVRGRINPHQQALQGWHNRNCAPSPKSGAVENCQKARALLDSFNK